MRAESKPIWASVATSTAVKRHWLEARKNQLLSNKYSKPRVKLDKVPMCLTN
jgi:hypothetical protein